MSQDGEVQTLAAWAQQELESDAKKLAPLVFDTRSFPDGQSLNEHQYAELIKRNWADQSWRLREADRNPAAFLRAFRALGGVMAPGEGA